MRIHAIKHQRSAARRLCYVGAMACIPVGAFLHEALWLGLAFCAMAGFLLWSES